MTIWSLIDKSVQYIQGPKYNGADKQSPGVAFSPNLKMMALIEKNFEDNNDMIGLYDISASVAPNEYGKQNWVLLHKFYPEMFDAQFMQFT